jgi:hypothetical protein
MNLYIHKYKIVPQTTKIGIGLQKDNNFASADQRQILIYALRIPVLY